jgi:hypothetical protein
MTSPNGAPATNKAATRLDHVQVVPTDNPGLRVHKNRVNASAAERLATGMIARHGDKAAQVAALQLNKMIDRGDLAGRDLWACVVHAIHQRQTDATINPNRAENANFDEHVRDEPAPLSPAA